MWDSDVDFDLAAFHSLVRALKRILVKKQIHIQQKQLMRIILLVIQSDLVWDVSVAFQVKWPPMRGTKRSPTWITWHVFLFSPVGFDSWCWKFWWSWMIFQDLTIECSSWWSNSRCQIRHLATVNMRWFTPPPSICQSPGSPVAFLGSGWLLPKPYTFTETCTENPGLGVDPRIGRAPKMDGENHGKPYVLPCMIWGENPLLLETPK